MLPSKIEITDKIKQYISDTRKSTGISAYDLSESIGKSKYWLSNIESGKTKFMSKKDFISVLDKIITLPKEDTELYIEDILNNLTEEKEDIQQLTFFGIDDEPETEKIKNEFIENINIINQEFKLLFDMVDDKKQALNIIKRIKSNIKSCDLGFIVSVYSLPWFKTTGREHDEKNKMIKEIINIINENALTCEECKNCKSKKDNSNT